MRGPAHLPVFRPPLSRPRTPGVCGNSVCEIGEADVPSGGQTGTCPEDCTSGDPEAPPSLLAVPLSEFPPPSGGNLSDASGRNATGQSPPLSAAEPAEGTYSTAFWESLGAWPAEGLVAVPAEVPPILDQTARGSAALNIRQASGGEADRDAGGEQCILARQGTGPRQGREVKNEGFCMIAQTTVAALSGSFGALRCD